MNLPKVEFQTADLALTINTQRLICLQIIITGNYTEKMSSSSSKLMPLLLVAFCLLAQSRAVILPQPSSSSQSCCMDNSIYVHGQGKVSVQPDIAIASIGVSVTSKTSQQASQSVAQKVSQITEILIRNNIKKDHIETQSFSIYPRYDYPNGMAQLVGQNAQQTLSVTVNGIDQNGGNLGLIIDQLVGVDGIQFNGLIFDKEDKSEAQRQARKLAFKDAQMKAVNYADLAERALGKVLTIEDEGADLPSPIYASANAFSQMSLGASTEVPVGKLDVSSTISVKFALR